MAALIVLLLGSFAGMAWFLETSQRAAADGAPPALVVAGTTPPGDGDDSRSGEQVPAAATEESEAAATRSRLPEHVLKLLEPERPESAAPGVAAGTIDLRLRHELSFGRLIVDLDERTVLSRPITVQRDGSRTLAHRLSVPSGRHEVRVEILGGGDELFAADSINARIGAGGTARLEVEHAAGTPHTITLKLSNDDEAGTRASH